MTRDTVRSVSHAFRRVESPARSVLGFFPDLDPNPCWRFRLLDAFDAYVDGDAFEAPVDPITLLQEHIEAPEPFTTRVEIVDGEFLYAIRSDTGQGFQLCPADRCETGDAFCPTVSSTVGRQELFT